MAVLGSSSLADSGGSGLLSPDLAADSCPKARVIDCIVMEASLLACSGVLSVSQAGVQPLRSHPHALHDSSCSTDLGTSNRPQHPATSWQSAWPAGGVGAAAATGSEQQAATRPVRRCLCRPLSAAASSCTAAQDTRATAEPCCTPAMPAAAAGDSAGVHTAAATCCSSNSSSCGASGGHTKMQQWLSKMELQLQVPATPIIPPVEPCPAPRMHASAALSAALSAAIEQSNRTAENRKRSLAAVSGLSLSSPSSSSSRPEPGCGWQQRIEKRRSSCDGSMTAAATPGVHAMLLGASSSTIAASNKDWCGARTAGTGEAAAAIAAAVGGIMDQQAAECHSLNTHQAPKGRYTKHTLTSSAAHVALSPASPAALPAPAFEVLGLM